MMIYWIELSTLPAKQEIKGNKIKYISINRQLTDTLPSADPSLVNQSVSS